MAKLYDYVQFHCETSDREECAHCMRDFLIPVNAIGAAQHSQTDTVDFFIQLNTFGTGHCIGGERVLRTDIGWTDFINNLGGEILNLGSVSIVKNE